MNARPQPIVPTMPDTGLTIIGEGHPLRMRFLPDHFGRAMMQVESRVYAYADLCLTDYTGGVWDFAETPQIAGFLIPPAGPAIVHVYPELCGAGDVRGGYEWRPSRVSCYDGDKITRHAAGLALTILAVNHLMARYERDDILLSMLVTEWERLMEYARNHAEANTLYRILD
jgi:hypothetical protein